VKRRGAKPPRRKPPSAPAPPDILGEHDGVTFQRERLAPNLRQLLPLLRKDWEENGIDRDKVPFALDLDRYLGYDLMGTLQIVTARDRGTLVGYIFAYVHTHIDHSGLGWAMLTWYWLYPEYRGGGIGDAMLQAMEKFLRAARVSVVEATRKIGAGHSMFERNGYRDVDIVSRKLLED
jgi:GNAT superfamily N-acetyltransferase